MRNKQIEIHQENTNETGMYRVWFTDNRGDKQTRLRSEEDIFNLLYPHQIPEFEAGSHIFNVNASRFKKIVSSFF